jgi:hypothetical protein
LPETAEPSPRRFATRPGDAGGEDGFELHPAAKHAITIAALPKSDPAEALLRHRGGDVVFMAP